MPSTSAYCQQFRISAINAAKLGRDKMTCREGTGCQPCLPRPAAAADAMLSASPRQRNDDRPEDLDADRARYESVKACRRLLHHVLLAA